MMLIVRAFLAGAVFGAVFFGGAADARDLGQWDKIDPAIKQWFSTLMQPDNPGMSCCGEGDGYWADVVETDSAGRTIAVITDDRDDDALYRRHVDIGSRFVVPPNKIKWDKGNPTGHVVIFLGYSEGQFGAVLCYVMNGGV